MKRYNYLQLACFFCLLIAGSGCLKKAGTFADDLLYGDKLTIIELRSADRQQLPSTTRPTEVAYTDTPGDENILLGYIRLASPELPKTAVPVKLKLNNAALPAGYVALPANAYTFVTPLDNFSIPAQSRWVEIRAILKKQFLDPALRYAWRFEIEDAGPGNTISQRSQMMMVSPVME